MGPYEQSLVQAARERRQRLFPPPVKASPPAPVSAAEADGGNSATICDDVPRCMPQLYFPPEEPQPPAGRVYVRDVIAATATYFGVTEAEICSVQRTGKLVRPRHIAMYLAKKYSGRSLVFLGKCFGDRDHTTVLHAVRKIEAALNDPDENVQQAVSEIGELINASR